MNWPPVAGVLDELNIDWNPVHPMKPGGPVWLLRCANLAEYSSSKTPTTGSRSIKIISDPQLLKATRIPKQQGSKTYKNSRIKNGENPGPLRVLGPDGE